MPRWVAWTTPARPAWTGVVAVAGAMLPAWTRRFYGLRGIRTTDLGATLAGRMVRSSTLLLPEGVVRSPAHRAALRRTAA